MEVLFHYPKQLIPRNKVGVLGDKYVKKAIKYELKI